MKASFYVVIDKTGFVNCYKSDRFELKQGQYATEVEIEVPDEAFAPMNIPKVRIELPANALRRVFEATVEPAAEENRDGS